MIVLQEEQRMNKRRLLITISIFTLSLAILGAAGLASASYFESTDVAGNIMNTYLVGSTVYVQGSTLPSGATYDIYIVADIDWLDGMAIPSPVTAVTHVTATGGSFGPIAIWSNAQYGLYDVVADRTDVTGTNQIGYYNSRVAPAYDQIDDGDVSIGFTANTAGLLVTPEYALGGLAAIGACFGGFVLFKKRSSLPKLRLN
jgi:hypothetical protein